MTTCNPQRISRPVKTGRYRQLMTAPATEVPFSSRDKRPDRPECEDLLGLAEKVAGLEAWRMSLVPDLNAVLEFIQQAKVLMTISISCGALALISLVLTILSLFEGKLP